MMHKVGDIQFRKIKRISPSQFYSMKNCAYKSLLAEAFDKKPLLPVSPNAYLGTVLHKILEMISKGVVRTEESLNYHFDEQINMMEKDLIHQGFSFFVPLQVNVKDFGLKKVLLKKHLKKSPNKSPEIDDTYFFIEKWYESKDGLIGGKIDLVIANEIDTEIIDYKTGAITQDVLDDSGEIFSVIKDEYKDQLKLYAQLYFENTGKFPRYLSLVDLVKQKFTISFSQCECVQAYEEAKKLLNKVNDSVDTRTFIANPSESNCKYCLYRPACSFFANKLKSGLPVNDAMGSVVDVIKYQNGNVSVFLENNNQYISVTCLPSELYAALNVYKGKQICIYNLRKEALDGVFSFTKTTKIYG